MAEDTTPRTLEDVTYEDFSEGLGTNRLPSTHEYEGKTMEVQFTEGPKLTLKFGHDTVDWTWGEESGSDPCDEVKNTPCNYFIDIYMPDRRRSLTLALNAETRRVIGVLSWVRAEDEPPMPGETSALSQKFYVGNILGGEPSGVMPHETRELIGCRTLNHYSPHHTYEHIYVNSKRYAWHNLRGAEAGMGDMDYSTCYKLEDNMYVFAFREKVIDVCSVFFLDYQHQHRLTGKFLSKSEDGSSSNGKSGAFCQKISMTYYPEGFEPQ